MANIGTFAPTDGKIDFLCFFKMLVALEKAFPGHQISPAGAIWARRPVISCGVDDPRPHDIAAPAVDDQIDAHAAWIGSGDAISTRINVELADPGKSNPSEPLPHQSDGIAALLVQTARQSEFRNGHKKRFDKDDATKSSVVGMGRNREQSCQDYCRNGRAKWFHSLQPRNDSPFRLFKIIAGKWRIWERLPRPTVKLISCVLSKC